MLIANPARAKQIRDFTGLEYGTIVPTDLDGYIEYHGKGWLLFETKHRDKVLPDGQRLALERMADDLGRKGKPVVCFITSHDVDDPKQNIVMADTIVVEYRWHGVWRPVKGVRTLKQCCDEFLSRYLGAKVTAVA